MDVLPAVLALAILVGVALIAGLIIRLTQTRVKKIEDPSDRVTASDLSPSVADYRQFGERVTLVQFSTQTCTRCPATSRVLGTIAGRNPDVRHIDIDVTERDELIHRYSILRTPTVLILDGEGIIRTRVTGPLTYDQAQSLVNGVRSRAPEERHKA